MYDIDDTTENKITNNLIMKYDQSFDQLYDRLTNMNNSIITKESYIKKITDEIYNKETNILILYYSIFVALLILIVVVLNGYKILSFGISIGIIIGFIVIISAYLYFKIRNLNYSYYFNQKLKNLKIDMNDYFIENKDKKCPSACTYKPKKKTRRSMSQYLIDDEEMIYSNELPYNSTATLNIDDQTNVWEFGNGSKDNKYKSDALYGSDNEIRKFNKGKNGLTYYECQWIGKNDDSLPNKEVRYSSIPCSYRQNFEEINRYICGDNINPNINGINSCDKV
jgi:hypothetical protein